MAHAWTFEALLEDMRERGMGVMFGKGEEAKEEALRFKQFAKDNSETYHVILDERKRWFVMTDTMYRSVNQSWEQWGEEPMKSY